MVSLNCGTLTQRPTLAASEMAIPIIYGQPSSNERCMRRRADAVRTLLTMSPPPEPCLAAPELPWVNCLIACNAAALESARAAGIVIKE